MESVTFYLSLVVGVGIAAQWLAWRIHLPAILVLLAAGFALGFYQRPPASIEDDLLFSVISLSVAVILFEGGLTLRFREMDDCGRALVQLVSLGALLTWGLSTVFARYVLSVGWPMANIIGSILVVTGPTVIGPLLRHVRPSGRVAAVAKWEGIVIDPVGAVLAVLVLHAVFADSAGKAMSDTVLGIFLTVFVGAVTGYLAHRVLVEVFKRHWIPDYLDNALTLAMVFLTFAISNRIQPESGLVTVTVFGVMMANQQVTPIRHLIEFKEILRVLLISILFIVLSSRIHWQDLIGLGWPALGFVLLLILVVRPLAVLLSTVGAELRFKERLFLSWLAPRGIVAAAVSSIFVLEIQHLAEKSDGSGTLQQLADESAILSPLVFLVIVGTVLVYGLTAKPVARFLGIGEPNPTGVLFVGADPLTVEMASMLDSLNVPVLLVDSNYGKAAAARMRGLRASNHLITTEHVADHLDLRGIGHLLAMTANDQVNALAMIQLGEIFDRSESFQLVPASSSQNGEKQMATHLTGRLLFDKRATWPYLTERHATGAIIKKTPLTEDFTWDDFQSMYGDSAIPLFVYFPETQRINIFEADAARTLEPGRVLIALIDPPSSNEDD